MSAYRTKAEVQREIVAHFHNTLARSACKPCQLPRKPKLLGSSIKVEKGLKRGVLTAVLYMSPANEAYLDQNRTACPFASESCIKACLGHSSGRLALGSSMNARIWKTALRAGCKGQFIELLDIEIKGHAAKAAKLGKEPAIRINGSTDTGHGILAAKRHPGVQFYDYTKNIKRMRRYLAGELPSNYYLTFSFSGENQAWCEEVLASGGNVAAIFETMPDSWLGHRVINGDETDVRYQDESPLIVGLTFKASSNREQAMDAAGSFVIRN